MAIACIAVGAQNVCAQDLTVSVPTYLDGTEVKEIEGVVPTNSDDDTDFFYFMNVATGKYLKAGANWGTRAVEGSAAMPIILIQNPVNRKWCLKTVDSGVEGSADAARYKSVAINGGGVYMDRPGLNYDWTFRSAGDKQYYIICSAGALCSTGQDNVVDCRALNTTEVDIDKYKWVLLKDQTIKDFLPYATTEFDCTPLLKGADFDYLDFPVSENSQTDRLASAWENYENYKSYASGKVFWEIKNITHRGDHTDYVSLFHFNLGDTEKDVEGSLETFPEFKISQELGEMPAGHYNITFQGIYRFRYNEKLTGSKQDYTINDVVAQFANSKGGIHNVQDDDITKDVAAYFKTQTNGLVTINATLETKQQNVNFSVNIPKFKIGTTGISDWITYKDLSAYLWLDNIRIMYRPIGTTVDPTIHYKIKVAKKINDTWNLVQELVTLGDTSKKGENAYRSYITRNQTANSIISSDDLSSVTNQGVADNVCAIIDAAYAEALKAYKGSLTVNSDATGAIFNHSFEKGNHDGWTLNWEVTDTGVYPVTGLGSVEATNGYDGEYMFNTWDAGNYASVVWQTIDGLPNGLYELKALVSSTPGSTVYLYGNKSYAGKVIGSDKENTFEETSVEFLVEDGKATIGAVGASLLAEEPDARFFVAGKGGWFKADNFRMKMVDTEANGRVKLAVAKAKAEVERFDENGKAEFARLIPNLDGMKPATDGVAEVNKIEEALTAAAKVQTAPGSDMTRFIKNPSFDDSNIEEAWTFVTGTETMRTDRLDIVCVGYDSWYLFNSWNSDNTSAGPISQSISGLPEGTYTLTARMTSDFGKEVYVSGNGIKARAVGNADVLAADKMQMPKVGVDFYVTGEEKDGVKIVAGSTNNASWYKVDDFRLTYLGPGLVLREEATTLPVATQSTDGTKTAAEAAATYTKVSTNRKIPANKWSTFVLPYEAKIPDNLDVRKFGNVTENNDIAEVELEKETNENFVPGMPYMVRPTVADEAVTIDPFSDPTNGVTVSLTDPMQDLTYVKVHGTYVYTYVPEGAWFISDNEYWKAIAGEKGEVSSTKLKGFRAYIDADLTDTKVKSVRYIFAEDPTTGIDAAEIDNDGVVAVFGLDGRRLTAPQRGVNIVKMSDGTVKKVLVK